MLARRLAIAGSGGSFVPPEPPPDPGLSGPYDPDLTVNETVLTQLHCHTNETDGSGTPAATVAAYLAKGYGALAITDHDVNVSQPAGITTAIRGNEMSPSSNHIVTLDHDVLRSGQTSAQNIIDLVTAAGGQAHVAHPKHSIGMTYAELVLLTGHLGLEVHNSHIITLSHVRSPFALDLWDDLLSTGPTVRPWGFSVDDRHVIDSFRTFDIGRVQVFVESNTVSDVVAALVSGNFVADVSNYGLTPTFPVRDAGSITLDIPGATRIEAIGLGGALLDSVDGDLLTYDFVGDEEYIRLVATGDYTEPFTTLSDRWAVLGGSWSVSAGVLSMTSSSDGRLVLRRQRQGPFTLQVSVNPTTSGSAVGFAYNCLASNSQYQVRCGPSSNSEWNGKFAVGRRESSSYMTPSDSVSRTMTTNVWHTLKATYDGAGRMRAKLWAPTEESEPDWQLDTTDTTWDWGAFALIGFGAPKFDDLYIDGFHTYYQPVTVTP